MIGYQAPLPGLTPAHRLPTNLTAARHPVHRWYNFIAGFSPELVADCIHKLHPGRDAILVDPFAGCGTALVESNLQGITSIGFEPHPFFADIALAKLGFPTDPSVVDAIEDVAAGAGERPVAPEVIWGLDALKFLRKLIPGTELGKFASACAAETMISSDLRLLYRMVISKALELACVSQTDGIYKAPTTLKQSVPFHNAFENVLRELRGDIALVGSHWVNRATLIRHSSEDMSEITADTCDVCVTSPPYLNNFDFAEMTRMQLYFWRYCKNWREITDTVRRKLIVNTTTAPTDLKLAQDHFRSLVPPEVTAPLVDLVSSLRGRRQQRPGKKDYHLLVYPYFGQMTLVLRETLRVLKPAGRLNLVVADSALYGVHIRSERILADIMLALGFIQVAIHRLRDRGDRWVLEKRQGPGRPLGEFHIHAIKP